MIVCQVTPRCNHWNFDRNNAYIQPHEGEPRNYIIEFNMNYYYKPTLTSCINKYFQSSLIVKRKINDSSNDDTRYHDEART
jgi:hypothetical protein